MKTGKGILAVFLVLPLAVFGEVVFLDTGFENGNRDTQDLPDHAAWFATHSHTRVAQVNDLDGNYVLSINDYTQSTVRGALAYFTDVDNGVTNKVEVTGPGGAHTIRLSFDFMSPEAANDEDRGLRFVLMDSHVRKTTDELSTDLTATGYMVSMNPADGTLHFRTRNRDADPSNLLVGIGNWDNIESGQSAMGMTAGVWYNMTIDIERLFDDTVKLTATMTDGENTAVGVNYDSEYLNYTFDTVGISAAGTALEGRLEIDNLKVSVIPEPAVVGMLCTGAFMALVIRRIK